MTKAIVTLILTFALVGVGMTAQAKTKRTCIGWQHRVEHRTPTQVRERRIRRLIRCVFTEVGIPGEVATAYVVADRESGLAPWAYNSSSGASGLFQHLARYWSGRARALPQAEFPQWPTSKVFNERANTWAAAQMVRANGWGAWTTI